MDYQVHISVRSDRDYDILVQYGTSQGNGYFEVEDKVGWLRSMTLWGAKRKARKAIRNHQKLLSRREKETSYVVKGGY